MHLHIHFMHGEFNYETRPSFDSIKNTSYKSCPSNWLHLNKNNNILAVLCQMMKMIVTRTQLNPTHPSAYQQPNHQTMAKATTTITPFMISI